MEFHGLEDLSRHIATLRQELQNIETVIKAFSQVLFGRIAEKTHEGKRGWENYTPAMGKAYNILTELFDKTQGRFDYDQYLSEDELTVIRKNIVDAVWYLIMEWWRIGHRPVTNDNLRRGKN